MEASLDAFPGLLEGLPLGALGWVMGAHSHDVGAGEDQNVGHDLWRVGGGAEIARSQRGGGGASDVEQKGLLLFFSPLPAARTNKHSILSKHSNEVSR